MPAQVKVTLSEDDKKRLISHSRCRTTPIRLVARSKIVLLASQRQPNYKIAQALGLDVNKVGRWRNRFVASEFDGIEKDRPRGAHHGGKNSAEQAKFRSKVIRITQEKPEGATHWRRRSLARKLGLRPSFVHRVWCAAGWMKRVLSRRWTGHSRACR